MSNSFSYKICSRYLRLILIFGIIYIIKLFFSSQVNVKTNMFKTFTRDAWLIYRVLTSIYLAQVRIIVE